MLNTLGYIFITVGIVLLIVAAVIYRRDSIGFVQKELSLIEGQGYADKHAIDIMDPGIYREAEVSPAQKKPSTVSREALAIMEAVEKERAEEYAARRNAEEKAVVASQNMARHTDILDSPANKKASGTDILPDITEDVKKNGTDMLTAETSPGTDVLIGDQTADGSGKGTDILLGNIHGDAEVITTNTGTDILQEGATSLHTTDVLQSEDKTPPQTRTDILHDTEKQTGTDILSDSVSQNGTDILQ